MQQLQGSIPGGRVSGELQSQYPAVPRTDLQGESFAASCIPRGFRFQSEPGTPRADVRQGRVGRLPGFGAEFVMFPPACPGLPGIFRRTSEKPPAQGVQAQTCRLPLRVAISQALSMAFSASSRRPLRSSVRP
jgi:hypothetical protein